MSFSGSLMTRNLAGLVNSNDIIQNSDYLQSVFIIILEADESRWLNEYESILPLGAVPRSARALHKEDGQILYTVVIMKKFVEEYVRTAALKRFVARMDFQLDSDQQTQETEAISKLEADIKSQWVNNMLCSNIKFFILSLKSSLVRLLKTNFGEVFSAWIHLKMLRLHVESILHYGLPPSFLTCILQVHEIYFDFVL